MVRRHWGWAGVLLACVTFASEARADDARREQAREHFERGVELVQEEAYDAAVAEFRRAYEISGNPAVLYNLGMTYVALGQPVPAAQSLERYLSESGEAVAPERRAAVQAEVARQRARIGRLDVSVRPEGALVRINGQDVGAAPVSIELGAGQHVVEASAAGHNDAQTTVALAGTDTRAVELVLTPLPTSPVPARQIDANGGLLSEWWFWTAAAVIVGGGVTAAVLLTQQDDVQDPVRPNTGIVVTTLRLP